MTTAEALQPEQVYTTTEISELLKISKNQVTALTKRDNWPHLMVGNRLRFTSSHVQAIYALLNSPEPAPSEPRRKVGSLSRQSRIPR
ncbi:helix-turn-helix domain-containing protein [Arthrobacter sp. D3-18]